MSIPELLEIIALVLALFHEVEAKGRSLIGWAVVLLCVALLWSKVVS